MLTIGLLDVACHDIKIFFTPNITNPMLYVWLIGGA